MSCNLQKVIECNVRDADTFILISYHTILFYSHMDYICMEIFTYIDIDIDIDKYSQMKTLFKVISHPYLSYPIPSYPSPAYLHILYPILPSLTSSSTR